MPQPPYSADLAPANFFLFNKTEDTDESKAFCYDKGKIETEAVGDIKKRFSEVTLDNRWITIREVTDDIGISIG